MAKVISRETMVVGILAVVAGLAAAYGVRTYMMQEEETPPTAEKKVVQLKMLLAGTDLPSDRVISNEDIMRVPMTRAKFDRRFKNLAPEEVIMNPDGIIGRRLKKPVKQGQPFLTEDFYLHGTGPSIAKKLQVGYRAIRVEVPVAREAGVQVGMYVDVLFRANPRGAKSGQPPIPEKTLTLLRHTEVIDLEHPGHPAGLKPGVPKKPTLFTLAVPEDKVDVFGVIEGRGEVWLVPTPEKSGGNTTALETVPDASTLAELLGIKAVKKPVPFETAIYRRNHIKVNKFMDGKLLANHTVDHGAKSWDSSGSSVDDLPGIAPDKSKSNAPQPQGVPANNGKSED